MSCISIQNNKAAIQDNKDPIKAAANDQEK